MMVMMMVIGDVIDDDDLKSPSPDSIAPFLGLWYRKTPWHNNIEFWKIFTDIVIVLISYSRHLQHNFNIF